MAQTAPAPKETQMKTPDHIPHESHLALGIKAATLVVLLGVIAVITEPARMAVSPVAEAPKTAATAPALPVNGDFDYFPSHFPAPTVMAEPMPTF
jgi:hypothetical protein